MTLVVQAEPGRTRDDWGTPADLFRELEVLWGPFDCDAAARAHNALAPYLADGLTEDWGRCTYVNPPYGRGIGRWIERMHEQAERGKRVVALLPAHCLSTRVGFKRIWVPFRSTGRPLVEIVPGRLTFVGAKHPAPFSSVIVVWR